MCVIVICNYYAEPSCSRNALIHKLEECVYMICKWLIPHKLSIQLHELLQEHLSNDNGVNAQFDSWQTVERGGRARQSGSPVE